MANKGYLAAAAAAVLLAGCDEPSRFIAPSPPRPPAPTPAAITVVAGDSQEGKAGAPLDAPFVVRATDAQGVGLKDIQVNWSVTSGPGRFEHDRAVAATDSTGLAQVTFLPTVIGPSTVMATVARAEIPSVTFTAHATAMVIKVDTWSGFVGPGFSTDVTVPVGTPVEWWFFDGPHKLTSTRVPPGGASFRSGTLDLSETFQFAPNVAGRWEYVCEIHPVWETGSLTAE